MEHRLFDYLNSRQLPTGRRIFAMKAVRRAAEGFGDAQIVAKCDRAIAADQECLRAEMAYRQGKSFASNARGLSNEYDQKIDAIWAGIHAVAQGQTIGEDAVAQKATEFLKEVFPAGLAGLVNLTFEAQLADMDMLLERFVAPTGDLAKHVDALGVRRHVDQLDTLVPKFRAELEKENADEVTYEDVKNFQLDSLDVFAAAVFAVLSTYDTDSARAAERRGVCLAEYHRQNAIIAEAYRRQNRVPDVDPDTGEPVVESESAESEPELAEAPVDPAF